eukprot:11012300-Lingulodinium_polyedra.AAC.1
MAFLLKPEVVFLPPKYCLPWNSWAQSTQNRLIARGSACCCGARPRMALAVAARAVGLGPTRVLSSL